MISLRYHIISIVAIFLALGLGVVLGSSVVSTPLDARLNADVQRYKDQRDQASEEADELKTENQAIRERLTDQIAPWAEHLRLADREFVFVSDSPQAPRWQDHVLDALVAAGAQPQGTILLSERWQLGTPEDRADLNSTVRSVVPTFEPEDDPRVAALALVGERFAEPTGRELIDELTRDGFVTVQGRSGEEWPPPESAVVLLSPSRDEEAPLTSATLAFARSVGEVTPTLAASDVPGEGSVVAELRDGDGLPDNLVTFDSATTDGDPGGIGVVAALVAATEGQGGHYGTQRGLSFMPAAPRPD